LIQTAIFIVAVGIFATAVIRTTVLFRTIERHEITLERVEVIKAAIIEYYEREKHLPCVARRTQGPDDSSGKFGREVNCSGATAGTAQSGTPSPPPDDGRVIIGSVPTRTLNLPDKYMLDGWGNRFTFIVSKNFAKNDTKFEQYDTGAIDILDAGGSVVSDAIYAIVSHGENDNAGAFTLQGALPVNCSTLSGADKENCDDDKKLTAEFVLQYKDKPATYKLYSAEDDYVFYETKNYIQ